MKAIGVPTRYAGLLIGLMLLAALGLAACGGDEPTSAPTARPTAAAPTPTTAPAQGSTQATAPTPTASRPGPAPTATRPAPTAPPSFDAASYFNGKTINILVGFSPGGGNDLQTRILADLMPKHIPGSPKIQVQNVTGGGGIKAMRTALAEKADGLTWLDVPGEHLAREILGEDVADFDPNEITMLGDFSGAPLTHSVMWVRTSLATSWEDIINSGRRWTYAETNPGTSPSLLPEWMRISGAPFKVVYGYSGTSEIVAATDRGEVDMTTRNPDRVLPTVDDWYTRTPPYVTPFIDMEDRIPDDFFETQWGGVLKDIGYKKPPHVLDVMNLGEIHVQSYNFIKQLRRGLGGIGVSRDVPPHVYQVLLQAFKETVESQEFVDAMSNRLFDAAYASPEELQGILDSVRGANPQVLIILRDIFKVK